MKSLVIVLFLVSLSFSSLIWQASTNGQINAKPAMVNGILGVASADGKLYAFDPATGAKKWQVLVDKTPNEILAFGNGFLVSTTDGRVISVGTDGKIIWSTDLSSLFNVTTIYGAATNQQKIFVTADNGVYVLGNGGSATHISSMDDTLTPPYAGADYIIFGAGNKLIKMRENGQTEWTARITGGVFWDSRPFVDSGAVYVGALDGSLHAFALTDGAELWQVRTNNWIMSSPVAKDGTVYFGGNDGAIYSVDESSGSINWKAQTELAIKGQMDFGTMGGKNVVFVGGTDKSAYAIDLKSGQIVWKESAQGIVGSPLYYKNEIIFGSSDFSVYAYTTERACSITVPTEAANVGVKELKVSGNYVSEAGSGTVSIGINGGDWTDTNTTQDGWQYFIDPKSLLNPGLNTISCRVTDSAGQEAGESFATITVNYDQNEAPGRIVVSVSRSPVDQAPFTIYANDADNGAPLERFNLTIAGKTYQADGNVTLALPAGDYDALVKKIGFNDNNEKITVNSTGISPIILIVVLIVVAAIGYSVWNRFVRKK